MKKLFAVALGVLTAFGGFLDIGDLVTNAVVGSRFGLALVWVVAVGVLGNVVLRIGDNVHTPILNNQARTFVDASVRYDLGAANPNFEGVRLQLNATNLFNEVEQLCTTGFCYFDEGRKVVASVRYRF